MNDDQQKPRITYKSSIALDLGAKFTGIFLANHRAGQPLVSSDTQACTLVMPSDGDGLSYSSQSRRAARHRMRGRKRFALARKLLFAIVEGRLSKLGISPNNTEIRKIHEALSALLKRRGYSRIEASADLTVLDAADPSIFSAHPGLGQYFSGLDSLGTQWEHVCENVSELRRFFHDPDIPHAKKELKKYFSSALPDLDKKDLEDGVAALNVLLEDAKNLLQALECGHKHRSEYLAAIREDIPHDSRLIAVCSAFGGCDRLWRLVGNLSNLQLRAYRWYFNAPFMANGNIWDAGRLQKNIVRAFQFFHPAPGQCASHKKLIDELKETDDIVECLCTLDPERTIPPYEDQNNRRPPLDLTLLLSPSALTQQYGENWKVWARSLATRDPQLLEDLDVIAATVDRKSRCPAMGGTPLDPIDYKLSYALQRALDRSKVRDPYSLRRLCLQKNGSTNGTAEAMALLGAVIGTQHVARFLSFCANYYDEVQQAKTGLWRVKPDNLLER
ncbi:MAG: type II-B CRISPR-associated RNA-guided endonuclease Cas9/Csx12, partial [Duodenibacillus sp.]